MPAAQPCLPLAPTPRRLYSELIYSCLSPAGDYSNDNGHDPKQIKNQWQGSPRLQRLRIRPHAASPASLFPPAAGSVPPSQGHTLCVADGQKGPELGQGKQLPGAAEAAAAGMEIPPSLGTGRQLSAQHPFTSHLCGRDCR